MMNKRLVKLGIVIAIVAGMAVLTLAVVTNTSLAQGPGGNGAGAGAGAGVGAGGQQGNGNGIGGNGNGNGNGIGVQQGQQQGQQGQYGGANQGSSQQMFNLTLPPATPGELPADVVDAITAGLLDEYHAYAVYQAVIDQFGTVRPFTNTQRSEAQHAAMLEFIFERYGVALPTYAGLDTVPQFESLSDACSLGVQAEIANYGLYDQWIETVQDYPDIVQVFTTLRDASQYQHLPAFEQCAG